VWLKLDLPPFVDVAAALAAIKKFTAGQPASHVFRSTEEGGVADGW
jgi:hypothetical protein